MSDDDTEQPGDILDPIKQLGSVPVAPAHGIAALALTLALKYHDINTVQDGTLYQQYKLEGKNMSPLHLDMVFETAKRMELHVLQSTERITNLIQNALIAIVEDETDAGPEEQA